MTSDITSEELRLPMPWGHVAAKAWGSPNNKHVLVVHGILDNAGSFDRLIPLLPHGFYFVCIDLPGHGLSSHLPAGIFLDHFQYVLIIRRVLNYLKWQRYIYIGHSFGALLGLIHSTLHPEGIEKLISLDLESPIPVLNEELVDSIRYEFDYHLKLESNETRNVVRLYTKEEVMHVLTKLRQAALNDAAAEALMKRGVTKVGDKYKFNRDLRLNTGVLPFLNNEQHSAIFEQLKTPILVILSSELALISNYSRECAKVDRKNKTNHFVTVEGNHDVHNNYPERVAPHICQFLGNPKSTL